MERRENEENLSALAGLEERTTRRLGDGVMNQASRASSTEGAMVGRDCTGPSERRITAQDRDPCLPSTSLQERD